MSAVTVAVTVAEETAEGKKVILKEEGDRLNKRATQLNELVHQIRRTQV